MRKTILTLAIILGLAQLSNAQTEVGGGLSIGSTMGIEAKANFGISDAFSISPYLDYYLVSGGGYTMISVSADGHYNFEIDDKFTAYPLVGLNYLTISGDGFSYGSGIGVNAGGGATYLISDGIKLYSELKYIRYGSGIVVGVLFSI